MTALHRITATALAALMLAQAAHAGDPVRASYEMLYVPAYSKVLTHEKIEEKLASTLVVHNTDPAQPITLLRADYHDETGALQEALIEAPRVLTPFETASFLVPLNDLRGGVGANFLVEWQADVAVSTPAVEAVMVGGGGTQGISFLSPARVIERKP